MSKILVPNPMTKPDYTFDHTPSIDEMRQTAIRAMRDLLSVQWCTDRKIVHSKTGAVSGKRFIYEAHITHAGLPYSNGGKGLMQFMEFYDQESGALRFYGTNEEFNDQIGCTCAGGVMWGLSSVCHTLNGRFINFCMTPKFGCYPVGGYHIDGDIENLRDHQTSLIIQENGVDKIVEAYTKIQPADAVTSSDKDHTMMCIDYPVVAYKEDGSIDLENSYVMIQDQRGGFKAGFYTLRDGDDLIHYSGRIEFKYTFQMLLNEYYIPLTPAEFLGTEPYETARIQFSDAQCCCREQLAAGTVSSNYPMAVIKLILTKNSGQKVMLDRYMFDRIDPYTGLARSFPMERMAQAIHNAQGRSLEVEVTASNGEIIVPVCINL